MSDNAFQERLNFYGFDNVETQSLTKVSKALDRRIDTALDDFYATVGQHQHLVDFFESPERMVRAKGMQGEHWKAVFRDGVDERFLNRSQKIGSVHARIGLEPRWYVGAYSVVLDHIITEIIAPGAQKLLPGKQAQAKAVVALIKVALLDIDLALSGYFEGIDQDRQEVNGKLGVALEQLAQGKLGVSLDALPAEFSKVENDFNSAISSLNDTIGTVISGVDTMTTGTTEIRSASNDLARRTEEQAANLEETAAAIAKTTQRVRETAQTTTSALETIESANTTARDGSEIVAQAVTAMDQIEKSSEEINNIISVIDSIAFQTNLLALNAGVEAARAGETGKGFAVVASEVRALAQRCAEAADEVKALISASSQHVTSGVDLVNRSGESFSSIVKGVSDLSVAIQTISESTNVQAESLAQINSVVGDLDRSTQQNAAMAEQCTAAASNLAREADTLGNTVAYFDTNSSAQRGIQSYAPHHTMAA